MDDLDRPLTDDELDRLWAGAAGELEPEDRQDLERALVDRPGLIEASRRVANTQRLLATLDAPGHTPDIASTVIKRLAVREASAAQPWLWLALAAQVALGIAAVAWAMPGLLSRVAVADWLPVWSPATALADAQASMTGWLAALSDFSRLLVDGGLYPGANGLWLGACVAGAALVWVAGNSVLLNQTSARRSRRR